MRRTNNKEKIKTMRTRSTSIFSMNIMVTSESCTGFSLFSRIILKFTSSLPSTVLMHQVTPTEWDGPCYVWSAVYRPGQTPRFSYTEPWDCITTGGWSGSLSWISQLYISVRSGSYLSLYQRVGPSESELTCSQWELPIIRQSYCYKFNQ